MPGPSCSPTRGDGSSTRPPSSSGPRGMPASSAPISRRPMWSSSCAAWCCPASRHRSATRSSSRSSSRVCAPPDSRRRWGEGHGKLRGRSRSYGRCMPNNASTHVTVSAPDQTAVQRSGARLDVGGVTVRAGAGTVLNDISFSVAPGELIALVGGSGAGKTTLLETMAGLRVVTEGAVLHDGVPVRAAERASGIGFVPQDDIVHRELPLRRVLHYAAGLRLPAGTTPVAADHVVDRTLRDLDLADRADVIVGNLSGGQRKRASIAVELLTRPRVLFLDEPTSGLDPSTAAGVLDVVRDLTREGVTVVLTTHSPADVEACDRVVFLAPGGHLAFAGSPAAA